VTLPLIEPVPARDKPQEFARGLEDAASDAVAQPSVSVEVTLYAFFTWARSITGPISL
jgi:hypothetical protein